MVWVLLVATGLLAVLVALLARRVLRLERTLRETLVQPAPDADSAASLTPRATRDAAQSTPQAGPVDPEFVITRVGEPEPPAEPVPTVPAPVFADLVLKETVVQTASLLHGVRRALSPETRHRIRFHVRQEVKRSRKQRKVELREVRREWQARQRAAMAEAAAEEPAA